jgi:hypothetical protein
MSPRDARPGEIIRVLYRFSTHSTGCFQRKKKEKKERERDYGELYILLYQASIPEPPALLTCAVQFFPLSTPLHPLTCQVAHTSCKALYILQGNVKYYRYLDNSHSYIAGISYSFPFPILCHPLMFTLCLCLTKEKSEIPKEMWEKKN